MIDVNNASIGFETPQGFKTVVHGVSLQVPQGQAYGLVGESGSGKSTVLRALCGMTPLCAGQMQVAGQPVAKHMPKTPATTVTLMQVLVGIGIMLPFGVWAHVPQTSVQWMSVTMLGRAC